jgi:hypothetical protein
MTFFYKNLKKMKRIVSDKSLNIENDQKKIVADNSKLVSPVVKTEKKTILSVLQGQKIAPKKEIVGASESLTSREYKNIIIPRIIPNSLNLKKKINIDAIEKIITPPKSSPRRNVYMSPKPIPRAEKKIVVNLNSDMSPKEKITLNIPKTMTKTSENSPQSIEQPKIKLNIPKPDIIEQPKIKLDIPQIIEQPKFKLNIPKPQIKLDIPQSIEQPKFKLNIPKPQVIQRPQIAEQNIHSSNDDKIESPKFGSLERSNPSPIKSQATKIKLVLK